MLYDRCLLTKRNNEWQGLVELTQRIGERFRLPAWIAFMICVFELFRFVQAGWYFNWWEAVILLVSLFAAIILFKKSSKKIKYRNIVIRIPQSKPVMNEDGLMVEQEQKIILPEGKGFKRYDVSQFTHVVFGLIDYPWPGRQDVAIEAFAVYLAEANGTPHPLVEGSFDKYSCYTLARKISALTKLPLIELGKGQPFEDAKSSQMIPKINR